MPLCTIHLLALHPSSSSPNPIGPFLSALKSSSISPLVVSRVIRWIILPSKLSTPHLLGHNVQWHIFLILPSTDSLPPDLTRLVQHHWTITAGVPGRLLSDFASKNTKLLHPAPGSVPKRSSGIGKEVKRTKSSQDLELSGELEEWIEEFTEAEGREGKGAVSMFNLLAFNGGKKSEYLKYGKAFADSIGSRHGGNAKIVGNVVAPPSTSSSSSNTNGSGGIVVDASQDGWDEIALAHYPSIGHFRDMLASEDYQEVNQKHRVGSLRDTAILMTSEVGIEETWGKSTGAKL